MTVLKLNLVDLDAHPDRNLLKACYMATRLLDRQELAPFGTLRPAETLALQMALDVVNQTEAITKLGLQAKTILALGDGDIGAPPLPELCESALRDFVRMGVPA